MRGRPPRLARPLLQPEQAVERVLLARAVGVSPALGGQLEHGRVVEVAHRPEALRRGDREVEVALDAVRRAGLLEPGDQLGDLVHRLDRSDVPGGWQDAERRHVAAEQVGLALGNVLPAHAVAGRPLQQRVVDVGDVLDVLHLVPLVAPDPHEGVEGEVGGGVPQVRRVVGRDAADVELGRALRVHLGEATGGRVVDPEGQRGRRVRQPGDVDGRPGSHGGQRSRASTAARGSRASPRRAPGAGRWRAAGRRGRPSVVPLDG